MGIFGNTAANDFKEKFIEISRLISQFSAGSIIFPVPTAILKIDVCFQELKHIPNRISSPHHVSFTLYIDSVFGES